MIKIHCMKKILKRFKKNKVNVGLEFGSISHQSKKGMVVGPQDGRTTRQQVTLCPHSGSKER